MKRQGISLTMMTVGLAGCFGMFQGTAQAAVQNVETVSMMAVQEIDVEDSLLNDSVWKDVELSGVEVKVKKPLVKMETDKVSYRVSDDVDAKTSTVLDMLRKVPMVTVDGQDNITVNGSSSFQVYVDGKPNMMFSSNPSQIFKSMPASMVKNIEVVTNPGAKYDAEGARGILNIEMNKMDGMAKPDMNGVSGSVRASLNTRGYGGGVWLGVQQGKLSVSANVNLNKNHMEDLETGSSQETADGNIVSNTDSETDLSFRMANVSVGYEIDRLRTINGSFGLTGINMTNDMTGTTNYLGSLYGSGFNVSNGTESTNKRYSINTSLDYTRTFASNKERMLIFSYQLSTSPSKNKSRNFYNSPSGTYYDFSDRYTDMNTNGLENTFQIDYIEPFAKGQKLEFGMKYLNRHNTSDSKYYQIVEGKDVYDQGSSVDYIHNNNILAGYGQYTGTFGNWTTKAGLRYEHTWQDVEYKQGRGDDFSIDFGSLVPSAGLTYSLGMTSNIGMTYNLRIQRPGITYLNPYVDKSSVTSYTYGNTNLDVEKNHNIGLVFNYFTMKLMINASLTQSFSNNGIARYSFYDDNAVLNNTYGNIVNNSSTRMNVYANWAPTSKTRFIFNGGLSYLNMDSETLALSNSGWTGNLMLGIQQTLPWNIQLSANVMANSKSYSLQGWSSGFNMGMLSLSKTFLNDKLSVSLMAMSNLGSGDMSMKSCITGNGFTTLTNTTIPLKMVGLNISWSFGKKQMTPRQKSSRIQNDVIDVKSEGQNLENMINPM